GGGWERFLSKFSLRADRQARKGRHPEKHAKWVKTRPAGRSRSSVRMTATRRYNQIFSNRTEGMLYYLVTALYILVCLTMMLVVYLQQGKGGDIASAFGSGSSQAAFGAR